MLYDAVIRAAVAKAGALASAGPSDPAELAGRLATLPRRERRRFFAENPGTANPSVVQHLLDGAWKLRSRDSAEATRLCKRALEAALRATRTFPRPTVAWDLCAEALGHLANLERIRGRFPNAERLFRKAGTALRRGAGNKSLAIDLLWLRASLKRAQRDFQEAQDLLRLALRWQAELEDDHEEGKLRVALGIAYSYAGEAQKGFDETLRALELLRPERDPELHFFALRNSVLWLTELGRYEQALVMSQACEVFYFLLEDEVLALRGRWVKGRLHHRCHEPGLAEWHLDHARRGFQAKGLVYEAALATLDLALIHAERHDPRKVKQLVEEMYPVFIDKAIPREASATLILFADSARKSGAGAEQIRRLIDQLHALRLH